MADCVFARRRYKNATVTLADLFASASVYACWGNDVAYYVPLAYPVNNSAPATGTVYLFSMCNGYFGVFKITNRAYQSKLYKMNTGYGGMCKVTQNYQSQWYYYSGDYREYTNSDNVTQIYGATMAVVSFTGYDEAVIDEILQNTVGTRRAYRNSSSSGTVQTNAKTESLYLCATNTKFDIWSCDGTNYTKIMGTSNSAGSVSGAYLTVGSNVNGGSIIGLT